LSSLPYALTAVSAFSKAFLISLTLTERLVDAIGTGSGFGDFTKRWDDVVDLGLSIRLFSAHAVSASIASRTLETVELFTGDDDDEIDGLGEIIGREREDGDDCSFVMVSDSIILDVGSSGVGSSYLMLFNVVVVVAVLDELDVEF